MQRVSGDSSSLQVIPESMEDVLRWVNFRRRLGPQVGHYCTPANKNGSKTKMVLMSLLHTAQLRALDPITAVEQMLLGAPMFPASA